VKYYAIDGTFMHHIRVIQGSDSGSKVTYTRFHLILPGRYQEST